MQATQEHHRVPRLRVYDHAAEMDALASEYKALQRQQESIKAQLDELKASIIQGMAGQDVYATHLYKISNKAVTSQRLDSKALQAVHPDIYAIFCKASTSTRFEIR
jgi:predicted phage-related endonuclease